MITIYDYEKPWLDGKLEVVLRTNTVDEKSSISFNYRSEDRASFKLKTNYYDRLVPREEFEQVVKNELGYPLTDFEEV